MGTELNVADYFELQKLRKGIEVGGVVGQVDEELSGSGVRCLLGKRQRSALVGYRRYIIPDHCLRPEPGHFGIGVGSKLDDIALDRAIERGIVEIAHFDQIVEPIDAVGSPGPLAANDEIALGGLEPNPEFLRRLPLHECRRKKPRVDRGSVLRFDPGRGRAPRLRDRN